MGRRNSGGAAPPSNTPAQQDEADIVAEIGAVPEESAEGEEPGALVADESKIKELGAVDAESVRDNRRMEDLVNKKRSGQARAPFNIEDLLEKYDGLLKFWPANTIDIKVKRLTGSPVQWVIRSRPKSGAELYTVLMTHHGRYEEAGYEVEFVDSSDKQKRGKGRIVLTDTRDQGQPTTGPTMMQQPMQPPPNGGMGDPVTLMQRMFGMFLDMQNAARGGAPGAPPPSPAPSSSAPPSVDPIAMMQQTFDMYRQMQQLQQQPVAPSAAPAPPPSSADPIAMMSWMMQTMQRMQQPAAPSPPPAPHAGPPGALPGMPPIQAPPGMFFVPGFGFVPADRLFQALGAPAAPPPPGPGAYRTAAYGGPSGGPPPGPPMRQKSAVEEFREAASVIDTAMGIADRFRPPPEDDGARRRYNVGDDGDDSNPVKVVDVGNGWPIVMDRENGSVRAFETVTANMGNVLKWFSEQREALQNRVEARRGPQRTLPPGYVEVTPGYTPPPGFVAVPVDSLPPPPAPEHMPEPIAPQSPRTWGAPPMPMPGGPR
jgi:hypothetical protein